MQVTETNAEGLKHEFKVTLDSSEIEAKLDSRLKEIGRQARIPGFRPGKVPTTILKKRFGDAVMGEVLQEAVADSANQAINERGMKPALQPDIDVGEYKEGRDLEYTIAIEVLPEIEPMDLSKVELELLKPKIDEKEVDDTLERLAEQHKHADLVEEPRAAKDGDVAVIDFVGKLDGTPFEGGTADGYHLELGSASFIPGFEEQVVGMKPGDEKAITVKFPDDYGNDELKGKEVEFDVKLTELREPKPMEVGEGLAEHVGMDSLDALKEAIRTDLGRQYEQIARNRAKRQLLDILADNHDFQVPEGMVDLEFDQIWRQIEQRREHGELDEEDQDKSDEELRADYRAIAERRVRLGLLLSEIGQRNDIEVTDQEVNQALIMEAQKYPGQERQVIEFYQKNPDAMASLRAPIYETKVVDYILELAKVDEREVPVEELLKEPEEGSAQGEKKAAPKKSRGKKAAANKTQAKGDTAKKAESKTAKSKASAGKAADAKKPAAKRSDG